MILSGFKSFVLQECDSKWFADAFFRKSVIQKGLAGKTTLGAERPAHRQQEHVRQRSHVQFSVADVTIFGLKSQGKINRWESRSWRGAAEACGFPGGGIMDLRLLRADISTEQARSGASSGETHPGS